MKYTRFGNHDELILAIKLKNAFKKANEKYGYDLKFDIKNIIINGAKRGCSGFVTNKENGSCVYVNTERTCCLNLGVMYRYADNNKDFTGYSNRWTGRNYDVNSLADVVLALLDKTPKQIGERRI
jgi:hypothetical protein